MANTKSALKMIRKAERQHAVNQMRRSRIKTFIKKVTNAIMMGNKETVVEMQRLAQPEIHRGVTKGILSKNKAANILRKLSAKVKAFCLGKTGVSS